MNSMFYAIAIIVCAIMAYASYSEDSKNKAIVELIKSGMNPVEARCSVDFIHSQCPEPEKENCEK